MLVLPLLDSVHDAASQTTTISTNCILDTHYAPRLTGASIQHQSESRAAYRTLTLHLSLSLSHSLEMVDNSSGFLSTR
jgi:hypothetical protein